MATPMRRLRDLKVDRYMATAVLTLEPDMEVVQAIRLLVKYKYSRAPVVDGIGKLIGVLSEKDCLKIAVLANTQDFSAPLVGDYMTTLIESVTPDTDLLDVASRFLRVSYKRLPVVDASKLVGQISRADVLRAIEELDRS